MTKETMAEQYRKLFYMRTARDDPHATFRMQYEKRTKMVDEDSHIGNCAVVITFTDDSKVRESLMKVCEIVQEDTQKATMAGEYYRLFYLHPRMKDEAYAWFRLRHEKTKESVTSRNHNGYDSVIVEFTDGSKVRQFHIKACEVEND